MIDTITSTISTGVTPGLNFRLQGPTPVCLEELGMASVEDTWMQRVVRFWNSSASLPTDHLFARMARGDCFLGVTTRLPTWAGSVMKAVHDFGYP